MANLEGPLNSLAIRQVLKTLIEKNPASTWLISDGSDEKVIYFSTGGVRLHSSPGRSQGSIEDFLLRSGRVSRDMLELARRDLDQRRESLMDVLERLGCLSRKEFQQATADLVFHELCDVVTWENAIHEFFEGNPPSEIFDQDHPAVFSTTDVTQMAERALEWSRAWERLKSRLRSERVRPILLAPLKGNKVRLSSEAEQLYRCINGERTLRELSLISRLGLPTVATLVSDGMQAGLLRGTLVPERPPSSEGEILEEIEKLEAALDRAINTILIHRRIASNYEKLDENDSASRHLQAIGDLQQQAGDLSRALESYRRAVDLSPGNFVAHEQLIGLLQRNGDTERALGEIFTLAEALLSFGFVQKAFDSLVGIIAKARHRLDIRLFYSDLLIRLGRRSEAVAELLGVVRYKEQHGDSDRIESLCQKILSLDRGNREARSVLGRDRGRRVGAPLVWLYRISLAAAAFVMASWIGVEMLARTAWPEVERKVQESAGNLPLDVALGELRSFNERYPATLVSGRVLAMEETVYRSSLQELEEKLHEAARLKAAGSVTRAMDLFAEVLDIAVVESQTQRAREGLSEAKAFVKTWTEARKDAEGLVDAGFLNRGFALCRRVIENHPEGAQGLSVPFLIRSTPDGCAVQVDGVSVGWTPVWIRVEYGTGQRVTVRSSSNETVELTEIENQERPDVTVSFR